MKSVLLQMKSKTKRGRGKKEVVAGQKQKWRFCSERRSNFSLEIRAIRPSAVFGTRRRTALRREGFAWVPDLGCFLKLREVGNFPTCVISILNVI